MAFSVVLKTNYKRVLFKVFFMRNDYFHMEYAIYSLRLLQQFSDSGDQWY